MLLLQVHLELLSIFQIAFPLLLELEPLGFLVRHNFFLVLLVCLQQLVLLLDQTGQRCSICESEQGLIGHCGLFLSFNRFTLRFCWNLLDRHIELELSFLVGVSLAAICRFPFFLFLV